MSLQSASSVSGRGSALFVQGRAEHVQKYEMSLVDSPRDYEEPSCVTDRLCEAIEDGDCNAVDELLSQEPDDACWPPLNKSQQLSPLHVAIKCGKLKILCKLLDSGKFHVNVQSQNPSKRGWTPLHFAALSMDPEAICLLHQHGCDPCLLTMLKSTPLHFVTGRNEQRGKGNEWQVISQLLAMGVDPTAKDAFGCTCTHNSINWYHIEGLVVMLTSLWDWFSMNFIIPTPSGLMPHEFNNVKNINPDVQKHLKFAYQKVQKVVLGQPFSLPLQHNSQQPLNNGSANKPASGASASPPDYYIQAERFIIPGPSTTAEQLCTTLYSLLSGRSSDGSSADGASATRAFYCFQQESVECVMTVESLCQQEGVFVRVRSQEHCSGVSRCCCDLLDEVVAKACKATGCTVRTLLCQHHGTQTGPTYSNDETPLKGDGNLQCLEDAHTVRRRLNFSNQGALDCWSPEILQKAVRACYKSMVCFMKPEYLIPALVQEGYLTEEEAGQLIACGTSRSQSITLLSWMPGKGMGVYPVLFQALQEEKEHRGHRDLRQILSDKCSEIASRGLFSAASSGGRPHSLLESGIQSLSFTSRYQQSPLLRSSPASQRYSSVDSGFKGSAGTSSPSVRNVETVPLKETNNNAAAVQFASSLQPTKRVASPVTFVIGPRSPIITTGPSPVSPLDSPSPPQANDFHLQQLPYAALQIASLSASPSDMILSQPFGLNEESEAAPLVTECAGGVTPLTPQPPADTEGTVTEQITRSSPISIMSARTSSVGSDMPQAATKEGTMSRPASSASLQSNTSRSSVPTDSGTVSTSPKDMAKDLSAIPPAMSPWRQRLLRVVSKIGSAFIDEPSATETEAQYVIGLGMKM